MNAVCSEHKFQSELRAETGFVQDDASYFKRIQSQSGEPA